MVKAYRGAFRTWLNIYNGAFFARIPNGVELLTFSWEKIHPRCLTVLKKVSGSRFYILSSLLFTTYKLSRKNTQPENMCHIIFEKAKGRGRKPTKKSFHRSVGIPVEFHWSHGKLLENDWNKRNLWNSSEIPLEFQQFIISTPIRFHL